MHRAVSAEQGQRKHRHREIRDRTRNQNAGQPQYFWKDNEQRRQENNLARQGNQDTVPRTPLRGKETTDEVLQAAQKHQRVIDTENLSGKLKIQLRSVSEQSRDLHREQLVA